MASSLKKAKVKLDLLTDINMLLIVKKVSEVKYSMLFINMRKLITNSLKVMMRMKNHHILSFAT